MESENKIPEIGVVIPTYNEESYISKLLKDLQREKFEKIRVVDGGSSDQTTSIISASKAILICTAKKGRAFQMNLGAQSLDTEYLLFLHADVKIPINFKNQILSQIVNQSFDLANFQLCFDSKHWFLKLNASFSKREEMPFQFGDQGLLIKTKLFKEVNGFDTLLHFMEGNEIIRRLRKTHTFKKLPIELIVSDRKYKKHGVFKLQFNYYMVYFLERAGLSQVRIMQLFRNVLE